MTEPTTALWGNKDNGVLSALPVRALCNFNPSSPPPSALCAPDSSLRSVRTTNLLHKITNISAAFVQAVSHWRKYGGTGECQQSSWQSIGAEHSKDN
jgi:hypothetical protein